MFPHTSFKHGLLKRTSFRFGHRSILRTFKHKNVSGPFEIYPASTTAVNPTQPLKCNSLSFGHLFWIVPTSLFLSEDNISDPDIQDPHAKKDLMHLCLTRHNAEEQLKQVFWPLNASDRSKILIRGFVSPDQEHCLSFISLKLARRVSFPC